MVGPTRELYKAYGGVLAPLKSPYFYISAVLFALSYPSVVGGIWEEVALTVMPSLTGFSIAAFAIIFAVFQPEQIRVLLRKQGSSPPPLLQIVAAIAHTILVQVSSIVVAGTRQMSNIDQTLVSFGVKQEQWLNRTIEIVDRTTSALGLFALIYGLTLVASLAVSAFQLVRFASNAASLKPKPASDEGPTD